MTILVTGATGYVGGRLVPRLLENGHAVRTTTTSPDRERAWWDDRVETVVMDVLNAEEVSAACAGVETIYYLIHGMGGNAFEQTDRAAATNLVQAARVHGVDRIIYLSGIVPNAPESDLSSHIKSRREVERILKRYFRDFTWAIRPPRRIQEAHLSVRQAREDLRGELGREPTVDELAQATNVDVVTAKDVQVAGQRGWPESMDRPRSSDEGGGTVADKLGAEDRGIEQVDARRLVEPALQRLKPREREVIYQRYYQDRTQREVGERIGISQMQISRIETKA